MHVADASAATTKSNTIGKDFLSGSFSKVDDGLHLVWHARFLCLMATLCVQVSAVSVRDNEDPGGLGNAGSVYSTLLNIHC